MSVSRAIQKFGNKYKNAWSNSSSFDVNKDYYAWPDNFYAVFFSIVSKKIKKTNLQLFMQYQLLTVKALQEQFEDKLVKKNLNQFLFIILGLKISNQPRLKTQFGNFKETSTNRYNLG